MVLTEINSKIDKPGKFYAFSVTNEDPQQGGVIEGALKFQVNLIKKVIDSGKYPAVMFVGGIISRGLEYMSQFYNIYPEYFENTYFIQTDSTKSTLILSRYVRQMFETGQEFYEMINEFPQKMLADPDNLGVFQMLQKESELTRIMTRFHDTSPFLTDRFATWHVNLLEPWNVKTGINQLIEYNIVPIIFDLSNLEEDDYVREEGSKENLAQTMSMMNKISENKMVKVYSRGEFNLNWNHGFDLV